MKALLVDDEVDILEQAKIFLQKEVEELNVETVPSAEKGLERLEEDEFDAIVSDYQMPAMDGLEFLETVRKEKESDIPFIIFTGKGREAVAMEALNLGADRYLQKGGNPRSQYGVLAQAIVQEIKHKKIEFEKAKVEAELSSLVKGSNDPIYIVDENCRIVFANQAELEKTGMNFEGIMGTKFRESHPEEVAKDFEDKVKKALESGKPQRQEVKHERSGSYYDRTISPIENPRTGEMDKVSVISKDVTERKREEELVERVFDRIPALITIYDPDMEEFQVNEEFERVLEWTNEEIKDIDLMEECYPDPEYRKMAREYMKSATVDWKDFEVTAKDGSKVESSWSNIILSDDRQVGIGIDKTKLKRKERELEKSREEYKSLAENVSDILARIDLNGNFTYLSKNVLEEVGYSREEIIGENIEKFLTPESYKKALERIEKWIKGAESLKPYEVRIKAKNGEILPFELNTSPLTENGDLKGVQIIVRNITGRKQREKELQRERKRFREIFNNANDAIYLHDLTGDGMPGRFIEVNDVACEMLGYSREEFLEMSPRDIDSPEKADEVPDIMGELFDEGDVRFEMVHRAKDGTEIPVEVHSHLFELEGEERVLSVVRDMSERKEMEKELRERVERDTKLFESLGDAVFVVGVGDENHGEVLRVNDTAVEQTGWSKEELVGKDVHDWIVEGPQEMTVDDVAEKLKNGETVSIALKRRKKDGSTYWAEETIVPFEYRGQKASLAVSRNITARKEMEQKAKREKKRYEELFQKANELIVTTDGEGYVHRINEAAEELSGYPEEELKGETILKIAHPEDKDKYIEFWKRVRKGEEPIYQLRGVAKDGNIIHLLAGGRPIIEDGETVELQYNAKDITDLVKTRKREEFLHSLLRHDVRNKAQIAKGYFELLQEEDLSEQVRDYLEKIEKACDEAVDIIEKVRKLRKIEKESVIEEIELHKVIGEVIDEHENQLSEKDIELDCEDPEQKVKGGSLLEELFSNLVENTVRHSGCGKIRISSEETEDKCIITVEDDGCGIPEEDKERIFERGFKSGETGRSGLGLHLVRKIAESYDGSVEVKDSELGGARFDVYLKKG